MMALSTTQGWLQQEHASGQILHVVRREIPFAMQRPAERGSSRQRTTIASRLRRSLLRELETTKELANAEGLVEHMAAAARLPNTEGE